MAVFAYRAWNPAGRRIAGTLRADSPSDGRRRLRAEGLQIERFKEAALGQRRRRVFGSRARGEECVAEFARLLALLLRSGVPLTEGLAVLTEQAKGRWQVVMRNLRDRCQAGAAFADALSEHPDWFGELFVGAIRVGEQAGTLDQALDQLAEYLKDRHALGARLTTALVYPAILMVVSVGVVLFLMSYVIPQLLTVLTAGGAELPWSTRLLKHLSDLLLTWWPLLIAGGALVSLGMGLTLRTPRGRRVRDAGLLKLPLLGILLRKTLIARFAQQMSMMLASGTPFVDALKLVRRGTRNVIMAAELAAMEQAVVAGSNIAPTLESSRIFPPLVVRLVAVGQEAGELTEMLGRLRSGYETEVRVAIEKFTAALEPLLIILMAGIVGFIVFATLMPILQATQVMT